MALLDLLIDRLHKLLLVHFDFISQIFDVEVVIDLMVICLVDFGNVAFRAMRRSALI